MDVSHAHQSLRGQFLLATPRLRESYFENALIYICEHDEEGAMGLVVNQMTDLTLADVLPPMEIVSQEKSPHLGRHLCAGGPVGLERGFVLHSVPGPWHSSLQLDGELWLTTSRDLLQALADDQGTPDHYLLSVGYAGWGAGQLEQELMDNSWLTCPADPHILFEIPAPLRLAAAAAKLGINLHQLSAEVGHA